MNINKCVLLFSVVLCILLFYKLSQKETFQGDGTTAAGTTSVGTTLPINPNVQYRYRPTSWVNENDYTYIKNKFINDLSSTTPVSDGKTLSDLISNSLKSEGMDTDIKTKLDDLQNSISNINDLTQTSTGFLNNIDHLGKFQDNYSKKVKSILESKYQGSIDNSFNLKQKIADQKIKLIEDILSHLEDDSGSGSGSSTSYVFKSIRCVENDLTLNVEAVVVNNIRKQDGDYMVSINDNILFYELVNISESDINSGEPCKPKVKGICDYRCTDGLKNGTPKIKFDATYKEELKDAYFKIIVINDYNEYNSHIDAHNENSLKKFVYETDDIQYPFYLIQPKNHIGKCVNFEAGELGEFNVKIQPCCNTKTERFEAMIYETHDGCK